MHSVDFFCEALKKQTKHEIEKIIDQEVDEAKKRLEQRLRDMTDRIALSLLSEYDVRLNGHILTITVKKIT